jgi:hypothetical protein
MMMVMTKMINIIGDDGDENMIIVLMMTIVMMTIVMMTMMTNDDGKDLVTTLYCFQIIDPKIKRGLVYNGVPIPAPPEEVMRERSVTDDSLYLVLFFDTRRTW